MSRVGWIRSIYQTLCSAPLIGVPVRKFVRRALPPGTRVWLRLSAGPGKGLRLFLDPRYEIDYVDGAYEPAVVELLARLLRPGDVFYDVGAHIGFLSLLAGRLVGAAGAVFAFEADPDNAARIVEHARRNQMPEICVVPFAVWSSSGRVHFQRASSQSSRNRGAVTHTSAASEDVIEVEAVALDQFAHENPGPALVKVDVEGGEMEVLRGAEHIFRTTRPFLLCEIHDRRAADETTQWLTERGYCYQWLPGGAEFPGHLFAEPSLGFCRLAAFPSANDLSHTDGSHRMGCSARLVEAG